jgi:putative endonuclease
VERLSEYMKLPFVYILASKPRGTLYVGVTSNIVKRIWQHRKGLVDGFTKRHAIKTLVWLEQHPTMISAIDREKRIKAWPRVRKLALVNGTNVSWRDLWPAIAEERATP